METTIVYWGNTGITEKKVETTIVYWGFIGIFCALKPGDKCYELVPEPATSSMSQAT